MSDMPKAKQILERWAVSIKREDRKHGNMPPLFESLAGQLFSAGVNFEAAHEIMKAAAKAMYPESEVIKHVHAISPRKKYQKLPEFTRTWHKGLDDLALEAFYGYYDIEGSDPTKIPPSKKISFVKPEEQGGMVTEDQLNEEDYWKSVKSVTRSNPWLFLDDEDQKK